MTDLLTMLERAADSEHGIRLIDARESASFHPYRELLDRARRTASWFQQLGVTPGDRVALVLPTCIEFFDAFFGALACGAVPVPMYPPVRLGRLDEYHERTPTMLRACHAQLLVTERRIHRILGRTVERYRPRLGLVTVESKPAYAPIELSNLGVDNVAFIQFSSGTTAQPKPIRLTHRQILANVSAISDAILAAYPERDDWTHSGCSWLPLYHDMGLVGCVFVAMGRPRDLTLIPPEVFLADPAVWIRTLSRYKSTISPAPNFAYALCTERLKDRDLEGVDLSRWVVALNGAEPVTPQVLDRFVERFSAYGLPSTSLTPVYGLGEATLAVTFSPLDKDWQWARFDRTALAEEGRAWGVDEDGLELVSLGSPLEGFGVEIRSDDATALSEGQLGHVWIRGPSIMDGYEGLDDLNSQVFDGEWLSTGDRGFLLDGELYLFGRGKDTIVLNGRNYAPQDIERVLDDMDGVRAGCHAAVGVVTPEGERLALIVESRHQASSALEERIRKAVMGRCGLPCAVVVVAPGTLPRTSSGKISRSRARERFETGTLDAPRPVSAATMVGELFRSARGHIRSGRER
ncbi:MAG: AMP-binding protein [Myxococcota bacterium]